MTITKQLTILIAIISLLSGCSFYEETITTAENIIPIAWDYFENSNYWTAYKKFDGALDIDSRNMEAFHGRAWCLLILNNVQEAISDFNSSIYYNNTGLDPTAGLAIAYHANQDYSSAIDKAQIVLTSNPNYFFEHEPLINYRDLRLILAMSYFHTGNLSSAYDQIILLDSEISIAPDDSSTWQYDDKSYHSYAETLMAVIDYLDVLYGM